MPHKKLRGVQYQMPLGCLRKYIFISILILGFSLCNPVINSHTSISTDVVDQKPGQVNLGEPPASDPAHQEFRSRSNQADSWPMFRHDIFRTGNTTSPAPNTNDTIWIHKTALTDYTLGYCGSPAVTDGNVFIGGERPELFRAIDSRTGVQSWQWPSGGRVTSSPTVANGRVFFTSYDKKVHALNQNNGIEIWNFPLINIPDSSPAVYNGKVYVGDGQGDYVGMMPSTLYCIDENTGFESWRFIVNGQIVSTPTVVNDVLFFGSYDNYVYALPSTDPNGDGVLDQSEVLWRFDAGARIVSSAAVADDTVFISTLDGKLYALPFADPSGDMIISYDEIRWVFTAGNEIWSSVALASGRVFLGSHDHYLYSLPQRDPNGDGLITMNEIFWKFKTTDRIWSSPAVAGGKVFITSQDYKLWAVAEETGKLVWSYTMPLQSEPYNSEFLFASPAVVDGRIYIGNYDLTLYSFGSEDSTPPEVYKVMPLNNSVNVSLDSDLSIEFDEYLTPQLITDNSVVIETLGGKQITAKVRYNHDLRTMYVNPETDLLPDERYRIRLKSKYFQDSGGNVLDGNGNGQNEPTPFDDFIWYFNTSALVGNKPVVKNINVSPPEGTTDTLFEFQGTYFDPDGDSPILDKGGYIKLFLDDDINGLTMEWANDTNTPDSNLLDLDFTNGELFRLRLKINSTGTHEFFIECGDGNNTNRTEPLFRPVVINSPPVMDIPVQYVKEGEQNSLNLRLYVTDSDNGSEELVFAEDSDECTVESGYMLKSKFDDGGNLSRTVNVTVSDGINSVAQAVRFIISPVNDAPALKTGYIKLPDAYITEDELFIYHLDDYIEDEDNPDEELKVSTDSDLITVVGLALYMIYPHPFTYENVFITVTDGTAELNTELDVYITPENDAPVLSVPPLELIEDITKQLNLGLYIMDEETSPADFMINVISNELGEVELVAGIWLMLTYPEGITDDYLNISVTDQNITVYQTVRVTILPQNDVPLLSGPRAEPEGSAGSRLYRFSVTYSDSDLISASAPEPLVELVLADETYSMTLENYIDQDKSERAYSILLELNGGIHDYYFRGDDGSGEPNGVNRTGTKTINVPSIINDKNGGSGSEQAGFDIININSIRELFWLITIILVIAVLITVNILMLYIRRKKAGSEKMKPLILTETVPGIDSPEDVNGEGVPDTDPHESVEKPVQEQNRSVVESAAPFDKPDQTKNQDGDDK